MRRRRLHVTNTDPMRPQGDLRAANRQDSIDAAAMVGSSVSRHPEINFFGPQYVSHFSLWTISEPNVSQTTACAARGKLHGNIAAFSRVPSCLRVCDFLSPQS